MSDQLASRTHRTSFARNGELGILLESALVSAVVAILAIRCFLALTGFPQLGGHGLHIAHMLWGGLFMLASIIALLAFLGRRVQQIAAILGGVGFGTFIDELGKFITSDNNYFFRPTIALIYCIFVLLFLVIRRIEDSAPYSRREIIANALDQVKEGVLADGAPLPQRQKQFNAKLLQLLSSLDARDPCVIGLREALQGLNAAATHPPTALDRVAARVQNGYQRLIRSHRFELVVLVSLIAYFVLTLAFLAGAVVLGAHGPMRGPATFAEAGLLASAILSGLLFGIGVAVLPRSRAAAYRWFRSGILVSLLLEQVFLFYFLQLNAMLGLALNLVVLATLNYVIAAEESAPGVRRQTAQTPEAEPQ